jgi:hypothetical protein
MCDCGCNTCDTKSTLMLNESLAPRAILSEGLKYHMDTNKPLTEHLYRAGSDSYFNLWAEARSLYSRNILEITHEDDLAVLTETDLGHFGMFEGKKVPLDFPIELTEEEIQELFTEATKKYKKGDKLKIKLPNGKEFDVVFDGYLKQDGVAFGKFKDEYGEFETKPFSLDTIINEAKKKAKKNDNKKLNKPMRDSSGGKAYKVYVKDPKTKKIKTVRFGSGGLRAKINDKKARNAFAKRHKCSTKKDKTKAGYWSCRLPRYAKLLGLKSNFGGFW